MPADRSHEEYLAHPGLAYYFPEDAQLAYEEYMRRPFVCRGPKDEQGEYTSVTLPIIGYYRDWLTLNLARCVWNNTTTPVQSPIGLRTLDPGGVYIISNWPERIGMCSLTSIHAAAMKSPAECLAEHKRERERRIVNNKRCGRWAPSRKLHDGPERIFEEE